MSGQLKSITRLPRTVVLGDDTIEEKPSPSPKSSSTPIASSTPKSFDSIPPKSLFNSNLKQLSSFKDMRKNIKNELQYQEFVRETDEVLKYFDCKGDNKYDHELLLFVMNMAENFFVYEPELGYTKEKATIELLKPYYNDDEVLIKSIIKLVLKDVKKSTAFRRVYNRSLNFFCWIMNFILKR